MTGVSNNIIAYAESRPQFSVDDLISSATKGFERNTLSWHLSNLCKLGKLRRIGRGLYSTQIKTAYQVKASKKVSTDFLGSLDLICGLYLSRVETTSDSSELSQLAEIAQMPTERIALEAFGSR